MARPTRFFIDNYCYHFISRGNNKKEIFLCDEDHFRCLNIIRKAKTKYKVRLYAYCLMPNHFHLLIQAGDSRTISKFMHWIKLGYTIYFNAKYYKIGHLWQGRFKSSPVMTGQYLVNVATYIENNPVRADMVKDPAEYEWSSYKERCFFVKKNMLDPIKLDLAYTPEGATSKHKNGVTSPHELGNGTE